MKEISHDCHIQHELQMYHIYTLHTQYDTTTMPVIKQLKFNPTSERRKPELRHNFFFHY